VCEFIENIQCDNLAKVLVHAAKTKRISYDELQATIKTDPEDVLFLSMEWGLLYPVKTLKSGSWEDRVFFEMPGEIYEMPNIITHLVNTACITGKWDVMQNAAEVFKEMGEPKWHFIPELLQRLLKESTGYKISAQQIKKICIELSVGNRINSLIAEFKASGVMSPKLGSMQEVFRMKSPVYELNRALFNKKDADGKM